MFDIDWWFIILAGMGFLSVYRVIILTADIIKDRRWKTLGVVVTFSILACGLLGAAAWKILFSHV
ncbi:hypothetical protein ACKWMY_25090 [Serratia sp. J2]|uniref:hypothetical protein n=1 Tax=Serratia sp. J2 TaxID=3386551 RepID=UPI0039173118